MQTANSNTTAPGPVVADPVPSKLPTEIEPTKNKEEFFEADAGDGTKREDMYLEGKEMILCFVSVFFCLFLFALDQTIVATLLSTVGNKFNAFDKIGWLSAGFLIAMAVLVAVWGKLSIIFGRKVTMIVAIILFEAGSLMCALANDMNVLIGGRVLAGIGGGGIQSMVFIIITEVLPIHKRPLGMAMVGSVFAVASVLGPLIGGAFTTRVSWRWCFYINLPVGGFALALFVWVYNPPKATGNLKKKLLMIDYPGVVLLTSGLVVFLLALTFGAGQEYAWNSAAVIACFVVGSVVTIVFFIWNFFYSKHPMLPWSVVKIFQTTAAGVTMFATFGYFISTILYLSVYFQVIHNASAWRSGVDLLPEIISVVVTSMAGGIIVRKTSYVKPFAVFGLVMGFLGCGLITLLEVDSSTANKIGLMIPLGIGVGLQMQACVIGGQITAPKFGGGVILATTLINFLRSFGGALAGTLSDAVYTTSFVNKIGPQLAQQPQAIQSELSQFNLKSLINSTEALKHMSPEARAFVKSVVMQAIKNTFYMNLGFAAISMIAVLFITNKRLPTATHQQREAKTEEKPNEEETQAESDDKLATQPKESFDSPTPNSSVSPTRETKA